MPPFSLSDAELDQIMSLATAIPHVHRKSFLKEVAAALSQYPEDARGIGTVHREAVRVQQLFASNRMRSGPRGVRKYG
jgi:hypothetical protein